MDEEQTQVVESAETATQEDNLEVYEDDSTEQGEGAPQTEKSEQRATETPEQRQARIKRQVEREAKKLGISVEDFLGTKTSKEGSKEVDEKWLRTDLKADGIKEPKEQDIILKYIREKKQLGEDVTTTQALESMIVREEIAKLKSRNVPPPSTRTSGGSNDSFDYYAKNIKAGKIRLKDVPDAAMRQKLMNSRIF